MSSGSPPSGTTVPPPVLALAGDEPVTLVWINELGGLTFEIGAGRQRRTWIVTRALPGQMAVADDWMTGEDWEAWCDATVPDGEPLDLGEENEEEPNPEPGELVTGTA